jgi:hypothetical protein
MKIESFILYDDEPGVISKEVQRLLLNFNIAELAMFFVGQRVDRASNSNPHYKEMIKKTYLFLTSFARFNT